RDVAAEDGADGGVAGLALAEQFGEGGLAVAGLVALELADELEDVGRGVGEDAPAELVEQVAGALGDLGVVAAGGLLHGGGGGGAGPAPGGVGRRGGASRVRGGRARGRRRRGGRGPRSARRWTARAGRPASC